MLQVLNERADARSFSDEERAQLADRLVRCRILTDSPDSMGRILASKDPFTVLTLIQQIQTIRTLLESIRISVDRASKVIRDVRSFIKRDEHGATISVRSENGRTAFTVLFPNQTT